MDAPYSRDLSLHRKWQEVDVWKRFGVARSTAENLGTWKTQAQIRDQRRTHNPKPQHRGLQGGSRCWRAFAPASRERTPFQIKQTSEQATAAGLSSLLSCIWGVTDLRSAILGRGLGHACTQAVRGVAFLGGGRLELDAGKSSNIHIWFLYYGDIKANSIHYIHSTC